MAKGSGSTKGAANGHKQSLTFQKVFNGHWEMDVPGLGGGVILANDGYSKWMPTIYEATAWDGDYNMGEKKEFATLNAAKDYIKNAIAPSSGAESAGGLLKFSKQSDGHLSYKEPGVGEVSIIKFDKNYGKNKYTAVFEGADGKTYHQKNFETLTDAKAYMTGYVKSKKKNQ